MTTISTLAQVKELQTVKPVRDTSINKKDTVNNDSFKVSLSASTHGEYPVNFEKVADLKAQIQNGSFKVNSDVIASKILENLNI